MFIDAGGPSPLWSCGYVKSQLSRSQGLSLQVLTGLLWLLCQISEVSALNSLNNRLDLEV